MYNPANYPTDCTTPLLQIAGIFLFAVLCAGAYVGVCAVLETIKGLDKSDENGF